MDSLVTVHYDSRHPEFALLDYGWPKWSIGFSLFEWGLILGGVVFSARVRRPSSYLLYGLTRAGMLLGFGMLLFLPPAIEPQRLPQLAWAGLVLTLLAALYGRIRYPGTN